MFRIFAILLVAGGLYACTRVDVRPVGAEDADADGVRFYRPAPYLLIGPTVDEKGNVTKSVARIVWLPDKSQDYRMYIATGIGTAEMNPTLTDGWNLTALGSKVDTKVPETINAIAALIPQLPGIMSQPPKGQQDGGAPPEMKPGLYKILFAEDGSIAGFGPRMWIDGLPTG